MRKRVEIRRKREVSGHDAAPGRTGRRRRRAARVLSTLARTDGGD
ncbi:hypothetical protein GLA29479_1819 [Lysobacter antibioticus]|nr:hypothetical protein GLA29479_1819 [Lysobacter antibioticus]